jgi:polyvinyl alcohol dehydrogenase (cytochrome)
MTIRAVWRSRLCTVCAFAFIAASAPVRADSDDAGWPSAGHDLDNSRFQNTEKSISVGNVSTLAVKWTFTTHGDVSATPSVDRNHVYFPDWAGWLYAVNRKTGALVWQTRIDSASLVGNDLARATPVVAGNKVIVGTQGGPEGGGGALLAFDKNTGALLWRTAPLEQHFAAAITQSATVHGNTVFIGVSSLEETLAALVPNYPCCSFRGSMLAVDANTGAIIWKTYMMPAGYSGGAVWGSSPAVDTKRGQVYIATGNNYTVPPAVLACVAAAAGDDNAERACIPSSNHFDSILALDLKNGSVRWATPALPYDAWTVQCFFGINPANCPSPAGPDYDFAQAPALFSVRPARRGRPIELVGAGQKSGLYWALNPDTGAVVWTKAAGPGGITGGLQWGSAVDGARVYTANSNSLSLPWTLPNATTTTNGIWSALDAATGQVLWQVTPPHGGNTSGPVTTANGVVFGCSLDSQGYMYAMNAATGQILWSYASGGSCLSGAAIARGTVYWGSGYGHFGSFFPSWTPNNKVYAFALPGQHDDD